MGVLARYGCDLSRGDIQSVTPVFFAAQEGHSECLALLLSLGADGNIARADGATPLIMAAQNGHESCVAILLKRPRMPEGSRIDGVGYVPCTPRGPHFVSQDPLQLLPPPPRAGLESHTSSGYTALSMAVVAGQRACVILLLEAGADVETTDRKGRTPLYLAAASGDEGMCSILVRHGADPRRGALDGLEPAVAAASRGYLDAARRILEDAGLDAGDIFVDVMDMTLARYLDEVAVERGGGEGSAAGAPARVAGHANGLVGDGVRRAPPAPTKQPVAPLLPASVARLRANGRPAASPNFRGIDDTDVREKAAKSTGLFWLPQRGIMPSKDPSPAHDETGGTFAQRSFGDTKSGGVAATRPPIGPRNGLKRELYRAWSGVHGGEANAPPGTETPGRRRPVAVTPVAQREHRRTRRVSNGYQQETRQPHKTLLDRMATFLFDVVDRDHKGTNGQAGTGRADEVEKSRPQEHLAGQPGQAGAQQPRQPSQQARHRKVPREIVAI